jgi:hypothetical protein
MIGFLGQRLETLGQVAALWPIHSVVVQDEFTHDVVAALPDGRFAVFDTT